jgi:hypothetical protein
MSPKRILLHKNYRSQLDQIEDLFFHPDVLEFSSCLQIEKHNFSKG